MTAAASTTAASNLNAGLPPAAGPGQTATKSPPGPNLQSGSLLYAGLMNMSV